uniref:SS18 N-terminal domain-containing protein n=1 Tax=Felis catus TaxID=9685 RepID=A0ABI7X127_FELCA
MSVAFVPDWLKGKAEVNQETIQRLLEENDQLIRCIVEYQNKGRANECVQGSPASRLSLHSACQPFSSSRGQADLPKADIGPGPFSWVSKPASQDLQLWRLMSLSPSPEMRIWQLKQREQII